MIEVPPNLVSETFTATADTYVQHTSIHNIEYQTDQTEEKWSTLANGERLGVPAGSTVYFRCAKAVKLSTVKIGVI